MWELNNKEPMKNTHIELKRHRSAKSIVLAWCRVEHPKMIEENLLNKEMDLVVSYRGKKFHAVTVNDFIKFIRDVQKVWAFCEHACDCTKRIHVWYSPKTTYNELLEVVAHELEHATGTHNEKRCVKTGGLARYASMLIDEDLKFPRTSK